MAMAPPSPNVGIPFFDVPLLRHFTRHEPQRHPPPTAAKATVTWGNGSLENNLDNPADMQVVLLRTAPAASLYRQPPQLPVWLVHPRPCKFPPRTKAPTALSAASASLPWAATWVCRTSRSRRRTLMVNAAGHHQRHVLLLNGRPAPSPSPASPVTPFNVNNGNLYPVIHFFTVIKEDSPAAPAAVAARRRPPFGRPSQRGRPQLLHPHPGQASSLR